MSFVKSINSIFLFLYIEFSNQSAEEERDSSIHDSEKRQEIEKKITSLLYLPIKKDKETEKITNKFAK